jgi:hypothetical protein
MDVHGPRQPLAVCGRNVFDAYPDAGEFRLRETSNGRIYQSGSIVDWQGGFDDGKIIYAFCPEGPTREALIPPAWAPDVRWRCNRWHRACLGAGRATTVLPARTAGRDVACLPVEKRFQFGGMDQFRSIGLRKQPSGVERHG